MTLIRCPSVLCLSIVEVLDVLMLRWTRFLLASTESFADQADVEGALHEQSGGLDTGVGTGEDGTVHRLLDRLADAGESVASHKHCRVRRKIRCLRCRRRHEVLNQV